ncbi:hypothetical protein MIZ03_4445 [Rhodoferax lithotrophicus]|uniref:Uncharacterized protein n=1 Tax=Rhodoferax lithotrophicus TaxID=2798804 RepID=A0ABN6DBY4_9BURK|nr:hypothetical protein MIZ03_4445 [Rhodoferax sp. MIZ03]
MLSGLVLHPVVVSTFRPTSVSRIRPGLVWHGLWFRAWTPMI